MGCAQYCEKKAEHDSHIQFPGFDAETRHVNQETERLTPQLTWIPVK